MKKIFLACFVLVITATAVAQQKPHYTQYVLNQYIINPAITGIENYTDIKLSHRHQWLGIDDAPVTSYFTIHMPLGKKDYRTTVTSFSMEGENPRGHNYWDDYKAAEAHHGIGMEVINDQTGPISTLSAYATYAYHLGISTRTNLAGGFGIGFTKISLNASKLDIYNTSVDPAIYRNGIINKMRPDLTAGLYLYSADYFIGISAQQIIPERIDFSDNSVRKNDGTLVPHLFATAGYRFLAGENFNVIPSVMVKYLPDVPTQFDMNTKVQFRNFAWIGAGYRYKEGFNGMVGLSVSNKINASYSYDYTTSNLNSYTRGTHEIIIGFILGNGYGDSCPRNVW
jgi:type IX secretion system PorP/SprF family membrane protein